MKTNLFSKVAVTMMTVALGAGVVGSISGTVAWFQYSTRSTVAFTGASAHCTENLQIRLYKAGQEAEDNWKSDLTSEMVGAALKAVKGQYWAPSAVSGTDVTINQSAFLGQLAHGGEFKFVYDGSKWYLNGAEVTLGDYGITPPSSPSANGYILVISDAFDTVRPVTSGELAEGAIAADLYRNPVYQYPGMDKWQKAKTSDFVTIPLELRVKDVDGKSAVSTLAKNIFISKVDMAVKPTDGKKDITSALRIAVRASEDNGAHWSDYGTFSKDGAEVDTYGKLDLNKDTIDDTFGDFEWNKGGDILYGHQHGTATIVCESGSLTPTVDTDWFIAKNGTAAGETKFVYAEEGAKWKLGSLTGSEVQLYQYGIAYTGTPTNGNTLKVTLPDVSSTHTNKADSFDLVPVTTAKKGIADDSDPYNIKGQPIGKTSTTGNLRVELKIYLEGWQKLDDSALWDAASYIGSSFYAGVRFSADAHTDH